MPNIHFASNNIAHFPLTLASSDTAHFDNARVPYALGLSNYMETSSPDFTPVTGEVTWFHYRFLPFTQDPYRQDLWFKAYDENNNLLFLLRRNHGSFAFKAEMLLYDGATTLNTPASIDLVQYRINSVDIRYQVSGSIISLDLYINQALAGHLQFNANANGYGNPNKFSLGTGFTQTINSTSYFSEIIVADGDTRNARLNLLRPASSGAHNQWTGSLGVLADDDPTTGLTTIAADQRQTVTLTPYTGAPNISNLVAISSTTRGVNSPTKIMHSVRLSGIDYDGAALDVGFPLEYKVTDFKLNPATSLPWNSTDLAAIEVGFVSRA